MSTYSWTRIKTLGFAGMVAAIAACSSTDTDPLPTDTLPLPPGSNGSNGNGGGDGSPLEPGAGGPIDEDPDKDADPNAPSPEDDPSMTPATQAELVKTFAPRLHLHPDDTNRPANIDWYLSRVTMRFNHSGCPDHEVLGLGKVTQASLIAQNHDDNKSLCQHDGSKIAKTIVSDRFFLEVQNEATYKGSPRAEWKTYVVWRPRSTGSGLVDIEYWFFYPFNDGFTVFNHESDWEHVRVTIDPKANDGAPSATTANAGKAVEVKFSAHKGGTILKVGDAKLTMEDGTHPVSYVAKGTHANYPKPGSYEIPGTYVAKDDAKAATAADVWRTEGSLVVVGTRAAPKNGQVFVKYWGYWGQLGTLPETNGVTRHFP